MRSSIHGKTDFFFKMKRKPAQELLYQRVLAGTLSDEDIENSGQPLWVRDTLKEIKARGGQTQGQAIAAFAANVEALQAAAAAQEYPVYEWTDPPQLVIPDRGFDLQIETNEFILVDRLRNQMKVDYTLLDIGGVKMDAVVARSKYLGQYTEAGFIELVGARKVRG